MFSSSQIVLRGQTATGRFDRRVAGIDPVRFAESGHPACRTYCWPSREPDCVLAVLEWVQLSLKTCPGRALDAPRPIQWLALRENAHTRNPIKQAGLSDSCSEPICLPPPAMMSRTEIQPAAALQLHIHSVDICTGVRACIN